MPFTPTPVAGYKASIQYTQTPSVAMTNEAMTDSGDHTTFTVTNQAHRYWDNSVSFVVQTAPDGTTWTTASPSTYTIKYLGGSVTFTSAITGVTPSCRIASGNYFPTSFLGQADTADLTFSAEMADITAFSTTGTASPFKAFMATLQGFSIKLHRWWLDMTFFNTYLNVAGTGAILVAIIVYMGQDATERFEGYYWLKQDDIKTDVKKVVEESLDLQGTGVYAFYA